jgi:hypothetical protein
MAEDLELTLSRLRKETERLGPGPHFGARVFEALRVESVPTFGAGVVRFGRAMLAVAALSALVGATVGLMSEQAADESLAMTSGLEDLNW